MEFTAAKAFLETNHRGVVTTTQKNGAAHDSIVVCGHYKDKMLFVSVLGNSRKVHNLRRDPRCTVLGVSDDWGKYVVVEGQAQLMDYSNIDPEEFRVLLRDAFRACGGGEHSDWDEYDQSMRKQDAVMVLVSPENVYGRIR
ncbi:MAG: TIGR03618 family F420-dependent PPOX class oxidoreductase [SAR202 cluster bacterium]|jgi:PPOX class probable F420-dependent enzyme|nr:TIGR03618 family F420-dependent PPOX class oxidoreductase [SAR202 cluster bacterium]|tara:strand:- start:75 stop:497 length:423 start_codon:yes stop_codon:yes gene_type:complete